MSSFPNKGKLAETGFPALDTSDIDEVVNWAWGLSRTHWVDAAAYLTRVVADPNASMPSRKNAAAALQALPPHDVRDSQGGEWDQATVREVLQKLSEVMTHATEPGLVASCMSAILPYARRAEFDPKLLHVFHLAIESGVLTIAYSPVALEFRPFLRGLVVDVSKFRLQPKIAAVGVTQVQQISEKVVKIAPEVFKKTSKVSGFKSKGSDPAHGLTQSQKSKFRKSPESGKA